MEIAQAIISSSEGGLEGCPVVGTSADDSYVTVCEHSVAVIVVVGSISEAAQKHGTIGLCQ